ncbi:hypothetical protein GBP346_B0233 [Burkholderia pseudomallei MSHR346]|nr:hypothetical protein GBP346_B0233 [Burkholderia pseudomallei MSHR346]
MSCEGRSLWCAGWGRCRLIDVRAGGWGRWLSAVRGVERLRRR